MAELPIKLIVVLILMVLVLAVMGMWTGIEAGQQFGIADAEKTFSQYCNEYKNNNCAWAATERSDFQDFLKACQEIHGSDNLAFSCLYKYCCNDQKDICEGLCSICRGDKYSGLSEQSVQDCLNDYSTVCSKPCVMP